MSTDCGCDRTTESDMLLVSNIGPDVTMPSDGSTGHSDQYVPLWQHSLQTSTCTVTQSRDFRMAIGSNSGHGDQHRS